MNIMDMSLDEINALPPRERLRVKAQRAEMREKIRLASLEPMPTREELLAVDMRLGFFTDFSETPVYVKDNYGAYMDRKTGERVSRNSRSSRTVMEMPSSAIDGGSSRQDNAMNRFLQGGGVQADALAKKYRFKAMKQRERINKLCDAHDLHRLRELLDTPSGWDDEDYKPLITRAAEIEEQYFVEVVLASGQRVQEARTTSLAAMIYGWYETLTKLKEANDLLDTTIPSPRRRL